MKRFINNMSTFIPAYKCDKLYTFINRNIFFNNLSNDLTLSNLLLCFYFVKKFSPHVYYFLLFFDCRLVIFLVLIAKSPLGNICFVLFRLKKQASILPTSNTQFWNQNIYCLWRQPYWSGN